MPVLKKLFPLLFLCALLFLSACGTQRGGSSLQQVSKSAVSSASGSLDNNPQSSGQGSSAASQSEELIPFTETDYQAVWGKLPAQTVRGQLKDGRRWLGTTVTDDGKIYGFTAALGEVKSEIICYDLKTRVTSSLFTIPDKGFQPIFIDVDGSNLLFTEFNDNVGAKVVLLDLQTKTAKLLSDRPASTMITDDYIALRGDVACWSSGAPDGNRVLYRVYRYDIGTGRTSVVSENAVMPALGDGFIAWIGQAKANSDDSAVFMQPLDGGKRSIISNGDIRPIYLAAYGNRIVYSGQTASIKDANGIYNNTFKLYLYQNGRSGLIEKNDMRPYEFPTISNNYITWDENNKRRVFCIPQNKIVDLPGMYGEATISNKYIIWATDGIKDEPKEDAEKAGMYLTDFHVISP